MMKCGHEGTATTSDGVACCVICVGSPEAVTPETSLPDLTGRVAKCSDCGAFAPSKQALPFFKYESKSKIDSFACGCMGWD